MGMGEDSDKEIEAKIAGQELKAKGYNLQQLATIVIAAGVAYSIILQQAHGGDSAKDKAAVAEAAKEANKAIVDALKESNQNTLNAIRELTAEQKRSTRAITIGNCINDPVMRGRADARDTCKRFSREE